MNFLIKNMSMKEIIKILSSSGRKALTMLTAVLFSYSVIAYLHGAPVLPTSYVAIMAMVWAFYFAKDFKIKEIFDAKNNTK